MKKIDNNVKMFDLMLFSRRREILLGELQAHLGRSRATSYICTPNPEQIVLAAHSDTFKRALQSADVLIPDGVGLVWASRLLALKNATASIEERIPGVELAEDLLNLAQERGLRVLIIGGRGYRGMKWQGIPLQELTDIGLVTKDKGFSMSWLSAYDRVEQPTPQEERLVGQAIESLKPELVLVAFGAPYQELWLQTHHELLEKSGVKVAMVVGGAVDFIFGIVPRAPQWAQQLGLEWLYRLIRQPWRWRRQLRLVEFVGLTCRELFR